MKYSIFVSCGRNLEYLLEKELLDLGFSIVKRSPMGVSLTLSLAEVYRLCLWTRVASRVRLMLVQSTIKQSSDLYRLCKDFDWRKVFSPNSTFAISFHGRSASIRNSMYGAQCIKDAIVDYFKEHGPRPNVHRDNPNISLHAHLKKDVFSLSLDLPGYALHQRGYRIAQGSAPIKENLAAAILMRSQWPNEKANIFLDPFCGSGTFLIEAYMMATNYAPGLIRNDQKFCYWLAHDESLWQKERAKALHLKRDFSGRFMGWDIDPRMIEIAKENIAHMGLKDVIEIKQQAIKDFSANSSQGWLVTNPPYGERLDEIASLKSVYADLGQGVHKYCRQWNIAILSQEKELIQSVGLRIDKRYQFFNGALPVTLCCFNMDESNALKVDQEDGQISPELTPIYNRLMKNKKRLSKWLTRHGYTCYRLYQADLPDYAFAIDIYNNWAHVQEFAPPKDIPLQKSKRRVKNILKILPKVLNIKDEHIVLKQRDRQRGASQYGVVARKRQFLVVNEGQAKLKVNLHDYLDTGLFLDHRPLRFHIGQTNRNKKFLNLFCYTASFSVHAALGGAKTFNVDLSNTYLNWAKDNFLCNKITLNNHEFIQANCVEWLKSCCLKFDTILLDPPSFSNSKKMQGTLDIERDHVDLIQLAMKCLKKNGVLYFSCNRRRFHLSDQIKSQYQVKEITHQTLDEDFNRYQNAHICFSIENQTS